MRYGQPRPPEDAFLPVQRQMITVLGNQHLREQPGGRDTLVDHVRRNRRLDQRFARLAGPLAADMPLNREHARRIVQLLANILADTHALATAGAGMFRRFVMDVGARQLRWQRRALRLLALPTR